MKFQIVLMTLLSVIELVADNFYAVKFIVESPSLANSEEIFITGNHSKLGNWDPAAISLKFQDGFWNKTLTFPHDTHLEYKFTRGSWASEAIDDNLNIPGNFQLIVTQDTIITYNLNHWKNEIYFEIPEKITGRITYFRNIPGNDLQPRDLVVWLPPEYDENPDRSFPVLYMHDGQNLFSERTAATGSEWHLDEIADSLVVSGQIRSLIIVGIDNTSDRKQEYSTGKKGRRYRDFVIEVVKPMIDHNFRTLPTPEYTVTGGSSLGGLVAFILLWEHPEIFSKAICMSPAFKIERYDYVKTVKKFHGKPPPIQIYIDNGGIDLEDDLQPGIDAMLDVLAGIGYKEECDYYWVKDPLASHNETAWSRRITYPLKLFFTP